MPAPGRLRSVHILALAAALAAALVVNSVLANPPTAGSPPPPGRTPPAEEVRALAALFEDQPFGGGQVQPRVAMFVSEDTFLFLQLDAPRADQATSIPYLGLAARGTFCSQTRPDGPGQSFSHFHRYFAPVYGAGHGTVPASEGYWLSWMATDPASPGVAYGLFATPPPDCGSAAVPRLLQPDGQPVGASRLASLAARFVDAPFSGGQDPPLRALWANPDVFLFLEMAPDGATLDFAGLGVRGVFCQQDQPSPDFTRFQRAQAATWAGGAGGAGGEAGYWLSRMATGAGASATMIPGVDRAWSPTPPPTCA